MGCSESTTDGGIDGRVVGRSDGIIVCDGTDDGGNDGPSDKLGKPLGDDDCDMEGDIEGSLVVGVTDTLDGLSEAVFLGPSRSVGTPVELVGLSEVDGLVEGNGDDGKLDGPCDSLGNMLGLPVGDEDGTIDGPIELFGKPLGRPDGPVVGDIDGMAVGRCDGVLDG